MTVEPLRVRIPHSLGKDEAIRRMKRGLAHATSSMPFLQIEKEEWTQDRLTFSLSGFGQIASGSAEVSENDVSVEVILPWLLQRFGAAAANALKSRAQILLEKK